jgi:hypothetical protein
MNDTARGERLQIMLTQDELEALDNWRFNRRMPSRAAAVRELLKRGLANEAVAAGQERRTRSQDFGVIGSAESDEAFGANLGLDGSARIIKGDGQDGHG